MWEGELPPEDCKIRGVFKPFRSEPRNSTLLEDLLSRSTEVTGEGLRGEQSRPAKQRNLFSITRAYPQSDQRRREKKRGLEASKICSEIAPIRIFSCEAKLTGDH